MKRNGDGDPNAGEDEGKDVNVRDGGVKAAPVPIDIDVEDAPAEPPTLVGRYV